MPNIKSAKKRMQLSRKWNEANRHRRATLRTAVKKVRQASSADEARERLQAAVSLIDRAAVKGLMHQNKAARLKSQLWRHVESLSA